MKAARITAFRGHVDCSSGRVIRLVALALVLSVGASSALAQELPLAPGTSRAVPIDPHALLWPSETPRSAMSHPILQRGHDMPLITTGIALLSLGMAVGVFIAFSDLAWGNCHDFTGFSFVERRVQCGTAPLALIPFAGSALVGLVGFNGSTDASTGLPGTIAIAPQILGIILLLIGMHGYTEDLVPRTEVGDATLSFVPDVSSTSLGATVRLSL